MHLATWNLQHGAVGGDKCQPSSPQQLADAVGELVDRRVRVLALTEVDRFQGRSRRIDQARVIDSVLREHGFVWSHFAPAFHGWAAGLRSYPWSFLRAWAPGYGVMLAAKEVPRKWSVARLQRGPIRWVNGEGTVDRVLGGHPLFDPVRVLLAAQFSDFTVAVTHLSLHPVTARIQLQTCLELVSNFFAGPAVVAGDFNLLAEDVENVLDGYNHINDVCGVFSRVDSPPTYPSGAAHMHLDHVLYTIPCSVASVSGAGVSVSVTSREISPDGVQHSGGGKGTVRADALQLPLSDHLALVAHLPWS